MATNTPPVAQPFSLNPDEDTLIAATLVATDIDGQPLSYEIVTGPANGVVVPAADGAVEDYVYRPNANFNGIDSFTYRAFDGIEYSEIVTVDITVNSVADMPFVEEGVGPMAVSISGAPGTGDSTAVAALVGGGRVEVWHGYNQLGDTDGIYAQVYDSASLPVGSAFLVNSTVVDPQYSPAVAKLADGGFVITWTSVNTDGDAEGVFGQRFLADGTAVGGQFQANSTSLGSQGNSDVSSLADNGFIVAWESFDGTASHVFTQRYDQFGSTVGGESQVDALSTFQGFDPSVTKLSNGNHVVTWTALDRDGSGLGVFAQVFDGGNQPVGGSVQVNQFSAGDQSRSDVIAIGNGGFAVAFLNGSPGAYDSISIHKFGPGGTPDVMEINVPVTGAATIQSMQLIGLPDGGMVVGWEQFANGEATVMLQRLDGAGHAVGAATQVNAGSPDGEIAPSLALLSSGELLALFAADTPATDNPITHQTFGIPMRQDSLAEGGFIPTLLPMVNISDADSADLAGLTVQIKGGFRDGDFLGVNTRFTSFTADFTGDTLTVSGTATVAEYQDLLRTLTFGVANGGDMTRLLEIVAQSVDGNSMPMSMNLKINPTNQYLPGVANDDRLIGGNGMDTLNGIHGNDTLYGNDNDDVLNGGNGNDVLYGGLGRDTLNGGYNADTLIGGLGDDVYNVNSLADLIIESAGEGKDTVFSSISYTLDNEVEDLTLAGNNNIDGTGNSSNNVLRGNAGFNYLDGGIGDDTLMAFGGNDTLVGSTGDDALYGGTGDDVYYVDSKDTVHEYGGSVGGIDTIYADHTRSLAYDVENLTLLGTENINANGNSRANVLTGNGGNNVLSAGADRDTLYGGDGNDTLNGGSGEDIMHGGAGNDVYFVDYYMDQVIEESGAGIDTVRSTADFNLSANVENLVLLGTNSRYANGNELANNINGTSNSDTLFGHGGNDSIAGGDGGDMINGGTFSDVLYGGNGLDMLFGDAGYDTLYGGTGSDMLSGGNGIDQFVFNTAIDGTDVDAVTDFVAGVDRIQLENAVFTSLIAGALNAGQFVTGSVPNESDDFLIYDQVSGSLYYDADGNGVGTQVMFASFGNGAALTASDFVVI